MPKRSIALFLGVLAVGFFLFAILHDREVINSGSGSSSQPQPSEQTVGGTVSSRPSVPNRSSEEISSTDSAKTQNEEEALSDLRKKGKKQEDEQVSLFFVTERDFVRVAIHWYEERQKIIAEWTNRLEAELARKDDAPHSSDMEQAAAWVVVRDPRYSHDPALSVAELNSKCRNYVCVVKVPAAFRTTFTPNAVQMEPGSILNSYEYILFTHGFVHHLVIRDGLSNVTTHYLLANGFDWGQPE